MMHRVERKVGRETLVIETGKMAKQAAGAVTVRYGDTVVLVATVRAKPREGLDFFPLMVDYREKTSSAGKIPGGFFKREGRPTNKEILTMRMTDRPVRPLFPEGYKDDIMINTVVLSADSHDPDILSMVGASASLSISPVPFLGPLGSVRVGKVDGEFIINPTHEETKRAEIDLVVAGTKEAITMVECASKEVSEATMVEALEKGFEAVREVVALQEELIAALSPEKMEVPPVSIRDDEMFGKLRDRWLPTITERIQTPDKLERKKTLDVLRDEATRPSVHESPPLHGSPFLRAVRRMYCS